MSRTADFTETDAIGLIRAEPYRTALYYASIMGISANNVNARLSEMYYRGKLLRAKYQSKNPNDWRITSDRKIMRLYHYWLPGMPEPEEPHKTEKESPAPKYDLERIIIPHKTPREVTFEKPSNQRRVCRIRFWNAVLYALCGGRLYREV